MSATFNSNSAQLSKNMGSDTAAYLDLVNSRRYEKVQTMVDSKDFTTLHRYFDNYYTPVQVEYLPD